MFERDPPLDPLLSQMNHFTSSHFISLKFSDVILRSVIRFL